MTYRVLVTGSRWWTDRNLVARELYYAFHRGWSLTPDVVLVHGRARGLDQLAGEVWMEYVGNRPEEHPADWDTFGKAAGFIRNQKMVDRGADECLAFYLLGQANRGTDDCATRAESAGIYVRRVTSDGVVHSPDTWPGVDALCA